MRFSGGKTRGGGRPITVDDVMDVLTGEDTLSDEFKCEIERFVIDQGLLDEDVLKLIPVDYSVPMHNVVRMNVSITPMMTFDKLDTLSSTPAMLVDNFLIDKTPDHEPKHLIMQLHQVEPFRPDGFVNFNVIDGNAAAITALEYKNMNSVVGKPLNDFLVGEEMSQMLNDTIKDFVEQFKHSNMDEDIAAPQLELDMNTKTGATIRVRAEIRLDPEQFSEVGEQKLYYPMVDMVLVKRPFWELVQNGPMLITKRQMASKDDEVTYANQKAKSMMNNYKHLPVNFFNTSTTHEASCCLGVAEPTDRMPEPLAKLQKKFDKFYKQDKFKPNELDLRLGGCDYHAILAPLNDDKESLKAGEFDSVLCDCSGSVIVATDMKGRVIDMNIEATAKLTSDDFDGDYAKEHLGRHFTRYIDPLDRKLAVKKFAACLKSGKPKTFDKMIVMTSCDLSFEIGSASYDLTLRLQLYPHFDKYGKIAGIVLEGREVTLIKLESDAAAHIFSHQDYDGFCEPLEYMEDTLEEEYNMVEDQYFSRKAHAPVFGLSTTGIVEAVTHAALMQLSPESNSPDDDHLKHQDDILDHPFVDLSADRSLNEFKILCERVKADPELYLVADMFLKDQEIPVNMSFSTWYNARAEPQGILINMCGCLAAFEIDSDGYVLDCTPAAAQALGYRRSEILNTALVNYVDSSSIVEAQNILGELLNNGDDIKDEDWDPEEYSKVTRINMQRKTKRVMQTTWDAVRLNQDKAVALVIMHPEKLTNKSRCKKEDANKPDKYEELLVDRLKKMVPVKYQKEEPDEDEDMELSPVERAQKQTQPVKYHYAVMQKHGDIRGKCEFNDFHKYLGTVWQENRPWELHRLNVYNKKRVKTMFLKISRDAEEMEFEHWEKWWNLSDNRKLWDGGNTMEHVDPPGKKDPYDYDRK